MYNNNNNNNNNKTCSIYTVFSLRDLYYREQKKVLKNNNIYKAP